MRRERKHIRVTFKDGQTLTGWTAIDNDDYCRMVYFSETEDEGVTNNYVYIEAPGATFEDVYTLPTKPWALVIPKYRVPTQVNYFTPYVLGRDELWHEVGDDESEYTARELETSWVDNSTKLITLYEGRDEDE